jgi:serine/threonine protein phosphatase PrpC
MRSLRRYHFGNRKDHQRYNNHNHVRSFCVRQRVLIKYAAVFGTILLCYQVTIIVFTEIHQPHVPTSTTEQSSLLSRDALLHTPLWKPYELTPNEVVTGQVTAQSSYTGTYRYQLWNTNETHARSNEANALTDPCCWMHFPIEYSYSNKNAQEYTTSTTPAFGGALQHDTAAPPTTFLITQTGDKGYDTPNQDRSVIMQSYNAVHKQKLLRNGKHHPYPNDWFIAALFDGHGDLGHVTSHVAVSQLPQMVLRQTILQSNESDEDIQTSIRNIFRTIDTESIIAKVPGGGSTAAIVFQKRNMIYMASVGDSSAFLIQWFPSTIATTTETYNHDTNGKPLPYAIVTSAVQHKPGNPTERKRIEENGGTVYIPSDTVRESSRVIYQSYDTNGNAVQTGLAMSRSLGDVHAKDLHVVISDPDIVSFDLSNENDNYFVLLASDGIMDVTTFHDLILPIGQTLYNSSSATSSLNTVCRTIVHNAMKAWSQSTGNQYRDDMTLVVHKVR